MALIFNGLESLFGELLPTIKIENISISTGTDPEPESNPHINSSREYVKTGISGNKTVQNSSVALSEKQIENKNFFLDIGLSTLSNENFQSSLVLNNINFLDFIYVKVIQSLSSNLTNELLSYNFNFDSKNLTNINDYTEQIFSFKDFYANGVLKAELSNAANANIYKYNKQIRFTSKNPNKQHLDVFAFAYIDFDELINKFELNLTDNYDVLGFVSKQEVISNSQVVNESYVLTDNNNNFFIGRPFKGKNGKFYKQKISTARQETTNEPLNIVAVTNKKIVDSRELANLSLVDTVNSTTLSVNNINTNINKTYLSDLYVSRQKDNSYSAFFVFDIISYLKQNNKNQEIYDFSKSTDFIKIKKLNIIRKRVKTIDSTVYSFNEYTPDKKIISTSENSFRNITNKISFYDPYNYLYSTSIVDLNNNNFASLLPSFVTLDSLRKVASVSEIVLPAAQNYRIFTFSDFEMSKITAGEYTYAVEIDIEDNTNQIIYDKIDNLNRAKDLLLNYLYEADRSDMFSVSENKQTKKFVSLQNSKYASLNTTTAVQQGTIDQRITIQNSPWIYVPSLLFTIEKQYKLNKNLNNNVKYYYNLLNPSTTSPQKITSVLNKVNELIEFLINKYSLEEKQDKNTKSKNSNNIKVLNVYKEFSNVIDSDTKKIGISFIETNNTALELGIPKISNSLFKSRTSNEILKYFPFNNISSSLLTSKLSKEDANNLSDIVTYSTCYLSPSSVTIDKNESYNINSIDNSNLNLPNYDNIVNKSIVKNSSSKRRYNTNSASEIINSTNTKISISNNLSPNLSTDIQLSFITKDSLLVDAEKVFDNSSFYNADRTFSINDLCTNANVETKNEEDLSNFSSLTNSIIEANLRPSSVNDTTNNTTSITTIDKFNILSSNSILNEIKNKIFKSSDAVSSTSETTTGTSNITSSLLSLPLQIKSLMVSEVSETRFDLSSFNFDPFVHPSTKNFMKLNFQTICQIEYLAGFEQNDVNKPIWKLLNKNDYDSLSGFIIIKIKKHYNKLLNIGIDTGFEYDIYNEFCIVEKEQVENLVQSQNQTNKIVPNINFIVNNNILNTNNILNNLNINLSDEEQTNVAKQLIVSNTLDYNVDSSYVFSKLELNNAN